MTVHHQHTLDIMRWHFGLTNGGSDQKALLMRWLMRSKTKDIPTKGVDWIMLGANAIGMAIVITATLHAQTPHSSFAQTDAPTPVEIASLD